MYRYTVEIEDLRVNSYTNESPGYPEPPGVAFDTVNNAKMVFTVAAENAVAARNKVLMTIQEMIQDRLGR